jgi:WD40 repeat protein/cold shock CspA family protein
MPGLRSFVYVSEAGLAPFLNQGSKPTDRNLLGSVTGVTLGWPMSVSLERRGPAEAARDRPMTERVALAEKELRRHSGIGDLSATGGWVVGRVDMDWAPLRNSDTVLFCGYAGRLLVVLGGSVGYLTGVTAPSAGTGSHSYAIREAISNDSQENLGADLTATASAICVLPRTVRFLAYVIRHGPLAGNPTLGEFLLATPLYVETVDGGTGSASTRGTVRWFGAARGWGLITPDGIRAGAEDAIAFNATEIQVTAVAPGSPPGPSLLTAGQRVEFRYTHTPTGTAATAVRVLPPGTPPARAPGRQVPPAPWRGRPVLIGAAALAAVVVALAAYGLSGALGGHGTNQTPSTHAPQTATSAPTAGQTASSPTGQQPAASASASSGSVAVVGPTLAADGSIAAPTSLLAFKYLALSPGGSTIAADGETPSAGSGDSSTIYLWQTGDTQATPVTLSTPPGGGSPVGGNPSGLAFDPKNSSDLAVADYGGIDLWNVTTRQVQSVPDPDNAGVNDVAYTPDGTALVEGNDQGHIHVMNVATHAWSSLNFRAPGTTAKFTYVAVSPNGTTLTGDDDNGDGYVWNLADGTLLGSFTNLSSAPVFSPDGGMLAVSVKGTGTRLWDVTTRSFAGQPLAGADTDPVAEAFSPNGKLLAALDNDGTLYLWGVQILTDVSVSQFGLKCLVLRESRLSGA